jgi:RNA recognition motif-containing protein
MAEAAGGTALSINAERRVYICNLPSSVTEGDLKAIGEQVGVVEKATVIHDADGRPKGNAFITYSSLDAASRACEILHNLDIAGRQIKVREWANTY